jgi:hypothetical protein
MRLLLRCSAFVWFPIRFSGFYIVAVYEQLSGCVTIDLYLIPLPRPYHTLLADWGRIITLVDAFSDALKFWAVPDFENWGFLNVSEYVFAIEIVAT